MDMIIVYMMNGWNGQEIEEPVMASLRGEDMIIVYMMNGWNGQEIERSWFCLF
jgi:hypothetical protein